MSSWILCAPAEHGLPPPIRCIDVGATPYELAGNLESFLRDRGHERHPARGARLFHRSPRLQKHLNDRKRSSTARRTAVAAAMSGVPGRTRRKGAAWPRSVLVMTRPYFSDQTVSIAQSFCDEFLWCRGFGVVLCAPKNNFNQNRQKVHAFWS